MFSESSTQDLLNEFSYSLNVALQEKKKKKSKIKNFHNHIKDNSTTKSLKTKALAIFHKENKVKNWNDESFASIKQIVKESAIVKTQKRINLENKLEDSLHFYFNCALEQDEALDLKFVDSLLHQKVDINFQNTNTDIVLFEAAKCWHVDVVRFLVEREAKIDHINEHGWNILHVAAISDNYDVIKFIMSFDKGIDLLNKRTKNDETPLHFAARYNSIQVINLLISTYEVDQEARDYQCRTPLYLAAEHARKSAVKSLLDLNCKIEVSNKYGQTALFWIVTKIPEIANDALNMLHVSDSYARTDFYHLTYLQPRLTGVFVPYNERHVYKFPDDGWRIFLFIMGILFTFLLLVREIIEVFSTHRFIQRTIKQRKVELNEEQARCNPCEMEKIKFIEQEKRYLKEKNALVLYISEIWNIYDLISITLLICCIFTHIGDIINHSEILARAHIRIMSVTIIFIALRLLKVGRILNEKFGILVMTLQYVIFDIFTWLSVYILFLLPYACSFWMIFGSTKFLDNVNEDSGCKNSAICNTTQVDDMDTFNNVIFQLYRTTLGQDYDMETMNAIDPIMYPILTGTYIGITTLLLVNIFIAMLSSTFQRLYDNSKANMLLQKAIEIVSIDQILSHERRMNNYRQFLKICNPYASKTYNEEIKTLKKNELMNSQFDGRLDAIEDNLNEISQSIANISNVTFQKGDKLVTDEYFRVKMRKFEVNSNERFEILDQKMNKLESLLLQLINMKTNRQESRVDILNLDRILSPNMVNVNQQNHI